MHDIFQNNRVHARTPVNLRQTMVIESGYFIRECGIPYPLHCLCKRARTADLVSLSVEVEGFTSNKNIQQQLFLIGLNRFLCILSSQYTLGGQQKSWFYQSQQLRRPGLEQWLLQSFPFIPLIIDGAGFSGWSKSGLGYQSQGYLDRLNRFAHPVDQRSSSSVILRFHQQIYNCDYCCSSNHF